MVLVVQTREIHYEAIVVAHRARVAGRARVALTGSPPRELRKVQVPSPAPKKVTKGDVSRDPHTDPAHEAEQDRTKNARRRRIHRVVRARRHIHRARSPAKITGVAAARPTMPPPADKKRNVASVGVALVAAVSLNLAPAPALANVKYANDCDPICHVLDDGAAKSAKMEEDMKKGGADMGSALERLMAEPKAEEAAAKGAKK